MPAGAASQREFIDILVEALKEQETVVPPLALVVPWQPTTLEMAGVRHVSLHKLQQSAAALGTASRQQMATLTRSQEAVSFYYDRGVVIEQMWLA